jgi:hypothetical protein
MANTKMVKPAATEAFGLSPTLLQAKSTRFPSPLPFHHRMGGHILLFLCSLAFYIGPILLVLPVFTYYICPSSKVALWIIALDLVLILYPNQQWPNIRCLFQLWYEILHFRHNVTTETSKQFVKQNHLSILAMHPHGIIPLHGFLWCAFCDQYLPTLYGVGATTDVAQRLPVLRQVLKWISAGSAKRKVILQQMQESDQNMYILPGGVTEIFFSRRLKPTRSSSIRSIFNSDSSCSDIQTSSVGNSRTHVIKAKRYGLMKLALQTGSIIIPSYVFGGTNFFDQLATIHDDKSMSTSKGKSKSMSTRMSNNMSTDTVKELCLGLIGKFLHSLSRQMKGGITFFWGQYGTPMPYPTQITMVLGDPIVPVIGTIGDELNQNGRNGGVNGKKRTCKKIPEPTPEQVEELMSRYVDALERLFDQYKGEAGYENDILKIM